MSLKEQIYLNTIPAAQRAGYVIPQDSNLTQIIGDYIRVGIGILGVISLLMIIYSGVQWMTAAGDEKKVEGAKKILKNTVIGLVIVSSAYAITSFVFSKLGPEDVPRQGRAGIGKIVRQMQKF